MAWKRTSCVKFREVERKVFGNDVALQKGCPGHFLVSRLVINKYQLSSHGIIYREG